MIVEYVSVSELLAAKGTKVQVRKGETLFREGDASTSVYSCLFGRIKIFVTTPATRDLLLGVKTPGQVFGELSALDGRPRSAGATAMELSVVACMSSDQFLESLQSAPVVAVELLRAMSEHLRRSNARIGARDSESTTVRVGHLLVELGEKFQRHGASTAPLSSVSPVSSVSSVSSVSPSVDLPISQDELASWIGASREATARSLAIFRRAGAVSTGRQRITLHGLDRVLAVTMQAS